LLRRRAAIIGRSTAATSAAGADTIETNIAGADTTGTNTAGADTTTTGDHLDGIKVKRPDGATETCRLDCRVKSALRTGETSNRPLTQYLERPLMLWTAFSGNGRLKQPSDQNAVE